MVWWPAFTPSSTFFTIAPTPRFLVVARVDASAQRPYSVIGDVPAALGRERTAGPR